MNRFPTQKEVARTRTVYPKGTRIILIAMEDPYTKLKAGDMGTVEYVDDAGQIQMHWDCGSSLALIPGVDSFRKHES